MRVLFTFTSNASHFYPLAQIASAVRRAGHDVAFAGSPSMVRLVEEAGFLAFPAGIYRDGGPEETALADALRTLPTMAEREARVQRDAFAGFRARRKVPDILNVCETWGPDLLVRDEMDFGSCVAAERLGLPHAVVRILAAGTTVQREVIAGPLALLREEHGLPPDSDLTMLGRYLVLSPFPPSFRDPTAWASDMAHSIRPLTHVHSEDERLPPWISALPERPTIHFSLGTTWNAYRTDIFKPVLDGLGAVPCNAIVTVGRDLDPAQFGPLPSNIAVERFIPLSLLLPFCDLVVSSGGSGTIMSTLAHGLPLVLLPLGADQPQNADRCVALGVARRLDAETLTPQVVRDAILDVLADERYRANAERLRDEIQSLPGIEHAVALLERLSVERQPIVAPPR